MHPHPNLSSPLTFSSHRPTSDLKPTTSVSLFLYLNPMPCLLTHKPLAETPEDQSHSALLTKQATAMAAKWLSRLLKHPKATSPEPQPNPLLSRVFAHFDANGDGKISADELRVILSSIGTDEVPTEWAENAVKSLDSDGDEMIDYEDFVSLMSSEDGGDGGNSDDESVRAAFEMFEGGRGRGYITPAGLQTMLGRTLGEERTYGDCKAMIRAYDLNGDGVLDYYEFQKMMMA